MRSFPVCVVAFAAIGLLGFAVSAGASSTSYCGSVSYTIPHTSGNGHAALNNLTATKVSCATARSVAASYLVHKGKAPAPWHLTSKTIVTHSHGQTNTVGEEIFTRGTARVTGDIAN